MMKRLILSFLIILSCSKKTTSPENPQNPINPYEIFSFWGIKPNSKITYSYYDSTIYKYSFYSSYKIMPNPDTLVRMFSNTLNNSIFYKDSIWSIAKSPEIYYDTLSVMENYLISRFRIHFLKDIILYQSYYKYPYPLPQSWIPIQQFLKYIKDSIIIGNPLNSCSLIVYLDTLYIDSLKAITNKLNDTTYLIISDIFSRIKYRYKFDRIVLDGCLRCNETDTIIKENYAYKRTIDSIKLIAYKGIIYSSHFDTLYGYIKHHTNAEASLQTSRRIKINFIRSE